MSDNWISFVWLDNFSDEFGYVIASPVSVQAPSGELCGHNVVQQLQKVRADVGVRVRRREFVRYSHCSMVSFLVVYIPSFIMIKCSNSLKRKPAGWWGSAKRNITDPTATVVYVILAITCSESNLQTDLKLLHQVEHNCSRWLFRKILKPIEGFSHV